ncbi:hypothetical protein [Sinosporangium siamense]|uniref:Uncharacterized protein n=1 Tax=Sinosporangium siamense TaxID=1367973 RepID=A0A919REY0_9ACTN|nr:hypothetical protein [Sinosporangium siamense]GII90534.1 hypothetical protein Ssi02_07650 [Sinosporangium siamense]
MRTARRVAAALALTAAIGGLSAPAAMAVAPDPLHLVNGLPLVGGLVGGAGGHGLPISTHGLPLVGH